MEIIEIDNNNNYSSRSKNQECIYITIYIYIHIHGVYRVIEYRHIWYVSRVAQEGKTQSLDRYDT